MRLRTILLVAGVVAWAACAPADTARVEEGLVIQLRAPANATPEQIESALVIIRGRFTDVAEGISVEFADNDDETVTMHVAGFTDADRATSLINARGEVSFRPVLESHPTSPMIGTDLPNIDPGTGLTIEDDTGSESWLAHEDFLGQRVLKVGPAAVEGSDIQAVFPFSVGESGTWAVNVELSAEGADEFAEMSGHAATYPVGDPRREIAVVLDGSVISAPYVSPDVQPEVGITGGLLQIAVGDGENAQDAAQDLASVLGNEALPTVFDVIGVTPLD